MRTPLVWVALCLLLGVILAQRGGSAQPRPRYRPRRHREERFAGAAEPIAVATPASVGVATGRVAFDSERARAQSERGDPVILVRRETSTDDVAGFQSLIPSRSDSAGRVAW